MHPQISPSSISQPTRAASRQKNAVVLALLVASSCLAHAASQSPQESPKRDQRVETPKELAQAAPECTHHALHLPLDHGPHATVTPEYSQKKINECMSKHSAETK